MKKKLISILIANLFVAAPAFAQSDEFKLQGTVSLGGIYNDEDAVDAAKMNDIRDLTNGGLFGWDIKGGNSKYWLNFFGENIAREDQYIDLKGGMYGAFKYRLYSDSLTRNQLFGGKTPYAGAGSSNVTASGFPLLNTATWNSVDVGYDRRDDGGAFEWGTGNNPWFFRVDGNQVTHGGGHNRQQRFTLKRLGQVIIGARLQTLAHRVRRAHRGLQDHRQGLETIQLLDFCQQLHAVHARHHPIQQNGVEAHLFVLQNLPGLLAVVGGLDQITTAFQMLAENLDIERLVVNNQDTGLSFGFRLDHASAPRCDKANKQSGWRRLRHYCGQ